MAVYIHELKQWPHFFWQHDKLIHLLGEVRYLQGRLLGKAELLGFELRNEANLETLIQDIVKSSEIEGEVLNPELVRSSIAGHLGLDYKGKENRDRRIDGMVEMMLDATQNNDKSLTDDRLFGWHSALFPTGRSGMYKIEVAKWRTGAMQVVSGPMGREKIHFEAPNANLLEKEMQNFLTWFNDQQEMDDLLKAGIAHFWFVTIHPFDDGNGRIARAIADMRLSKADRVNQRFYSMSTQINADKKSYYQILEKSQKSTLDITPWLVWFLNCLKQAITNSEGIITKVSAKHQFLVKNSSAITNDRQRLMITRLLDGFEGHLTTSKYAKLTKSSTDTALRDITHLIEKDILLKSGSGGRSTHYQLKMTV